MSRDCCVCVLLVGVPLAIDSSNGDPNGAPLEEGFRLDDDGGHISSLLQHNYALRGRRGGILSVSAVLRIDQDARRILMPITAIVVGPVALPTAAAAAAALEIVAAGGGGRSAVGCTVDIAAPVRLDCVPAHRGREARVAHIGGRRVAQPVRGDHGPAAEVPIEMLPEHARHAVQRHRISARVEEAGGDKRGGGGGLRG